jgi:hypothetical protein
VKGWGDDVAAETPGHFRSCPNPVRLNVAIREQLLAAVDGRRGVEAADRGHACARITRCAVESIAARPSTGAFCFLRFVIVSGVTIALTSIW